MDGVVLLGRERNEYLYMIYMYVFVRVHIFVCLAVDLIQENMSDCFSLLHFLNINMYIHFWSALQLLIDGKDVKEIDSDSLRRHIGLVEQEPRLFNTTIRDNVAYGLNNCTKVKSWDDLAAYMHALFIFCATSHHLIDSFLPYPFM